MSADDNHASGISRDGMFGKRLFGLGLVVGGLAVFLLKSPKAEADHPIAKSAVEASTTSSSSNAIQERAAGPVLEERLSQPTSPSPGAPGEYLRINVKGRVQIDVPSDWTISGVDERIQVKDLAESMSGLTDGHVASFAAQSYPAPSKVFVRVAFIPMEPELTQGHVLEAIKLDRKQLLKEMEEAWLLEAPVMWEGLAKIGVTEVGQPSYGIERIGDHLGLSIRYSRTRPNGAAGTMQVTQYHIPLGSEKALITLSSIEGDSEAIVAHNRLKASITIR
jgi:hypothetical protein